MDLDTNIGGAHLSTQLRIKQLVLASNVRARPSLVEIARELGLTPRTLQRRLKAESTTYRTVLDQARLELAGRALLESATTARVAESLGFSEPAAFQRAFKRWTGTTVRKYLQSHTAAPAALNVPS